MTRRATSAGPCRESSGDFFDVGRGLGGVCRGHGGALRGGGRGHCHGTRTSGTNVVNDSLTPRSRAWQILLATSSNAF